MRILGSEVDIEVDIGGAIIPLQIAGGVLIAPIPSTLARSGK